MVGSCFFLLGGDANGALVSASFLLAEIVLARYGHTRSGYSLGCLLFSFGDALAIKSEVASLNPGFQITLALMAASWLIGAFRAPLHWLGRHRHSPLLLIVADALQPISGIATLVLRIPALISAIGGGSPIGAVAIACWAASDVFVGRLQDLVRRSARLRARDRAPNEIDS